MLRDYQQDIAAKAADLLRQYRIAYLSMEVRTGKTLTAMQAIDTIGAKNVLFLTKKEAISSIEGDYAKLNPSFTITYGNYESAHKLDTVFDAAILDESHSLGQFPVPAKKIKHVKRLCHEIPIIYLSGTPSPESYSQLFHQFYISSYSPFPEKSFYEWANKYVTVKKKYFYNRAVNDYSCANKDLIDQAVQHLFISFTQKEAGFMLPEVQEEVIRVQMNDKVYRLADKLKKDRVYVNSKGVEILSDTEVKLMNKLHQLYSGTVLDETGVYHIIDTSKAEAIKEKFAGEKIAVFYKYRGEGEMLKRIFDSNITTSPDEFNKKDSKVFISQIQSGREGINLSTASVIVMLNIDYSAVSYFQARARSQFKERSTPPRIVWLFSHGGIEDKIYEKVKNKKDYTLQYFKRDFRISNPKQSNPAA